MLSPRTVEQIEALATEMATMFLPPEMIVGCEVLGIADKDQYAANNGWIEARVGRHNQQRCRWRGQFANVQVGDYVDVLYFASYRLFVVFGQGGTAAVIKILDNFAATAAPTVNDDSGDGYSVGSVWVDVTNDNAYIAEDVTIGAAVWAQIDGGGGGWPGAGLAMINDTEYASVQLAIDAMASGDIIKVGQGTDSGGIVPDTPGSIVGLSPAETIITRSNDTTVTVNNAAAANLTLANLTVSHTGAGVSDVCIQSDQDGLVLDNLNITKASGAPTNSTGVAIYGGNTAGALIRNCKISITAGTNKYGVATATAASLVIIEGGEINAAAADVYIGHASSVVELRGVKLAGGVINATTGTLRGWAVDDKGRDCGKVVKNTSGATVNRGDIGYLDNAGEFKTTTTANNFTGEEHIVTAGGPNNGWIFVRRTGNATVNYTGTAPNAGEYLVTSTTAGVAQAQVFMSQSVFAVAMAAGSGGTVEALLIAGRLDVTVFNSNEAIRISNASTSAFSSTINGTPGATLVYNAPTGNENSIVPVSTSELLKLVLWNTSKTPDEYALIQAVNTGTNTITPTAAISGWSNGESIQVNSTTVTGTLAGATLYDIQVSDTAVIPALATAIFLEGIITDSSGSGAQLIVHPYEAAASAKLQAITTVSAGSISRKYIKVPITNRRFAIGIAAIGSGTSTVALKLLGYSIATP